MEYRVFWEIDIAAGTPEQAAKQALEIQRDPESMALFFDVKMIGPCEVCHQNEVHKSNCRIAKRDDVTRVGQIVHVDLRNSK